MTFDACLVERFDRLASVCSSVAELHDLICSVLPEMGFDYFALLHHGSLSRGHARLIRLDNYPPSWSVELVECGFVPDDPVHLASGRSNGAFAWDEIGALVPVTERHREIFRRSRRHGVGDGLTVPANVPGEPGGSCSFAVRPGRTLSARTLLGAELIGVHAFRAARRLHGYPARGPRPHLSRREQQCLRLIARGKSAWEIGRLLAISEETARQYIKRARAAYDVVTRTQLVVNGLRDGWIGFDDAIPPDGGMG